MERRCVLPFGEQAAERREVAEVGAGLELLQERGQFIICLLEGRFRVYTFVQNPLQRAVKNASGFCHIFDCWKGRITIHILNI